MDPIQAFIAQNFQPRYTGHVAPLVTNTKTVQINSQAGELQYNSHCNVTDIRFCITGFNGVIHSGK
jgi:hypothetical protein